MHKGKTYMLLSGDKLDVTLSLYHTYREARYIQLDAVILSSLSTVGKGLVNYSYKQRVQCRIGQYRAGQYRTVRYSAGQCTVKTSQEVCGVI
jgi:hypothetical protein